MTRHFSYCRRGYSTRCVSKGAWPPSRKAGGYLIRNRGVSSYVRNSGATFHISNRGVSSQEFRRTPGACVPAAAIQVWHRLVHQEQRCLIMYQSQRGLIIYQSQRGLTPAAAIEVGHRLVDHLPPGHVGCNAAVAQVVAHNHIDSAAGPPARIACRCCWRRRRRRHCRRCTVVVVVAVCPHPGLGSGLLGERFFFCDQHQPDWMASSGLNGVMYPRRTRRAMWPACRVCVYQTGVCVCVVVHLLGERCV